MKVEELALIDFSPRAVGAAPTIPGVVCDNHQLEHVAVQCLRHVVKCSHVLVQRWYRKDVRLLA